MSSSNSCFLTCIQVSQEAGQVVWYSHLFQNFPQFIVIHRVKGFGIVNKEEIEFFLEFSCFFYNATAVGNSISDSSAFSKSSLNFWNISVHVLLKPSLENFEHNFASVWDACNCVVVWTFFVIALLWDWNENWPFPVLWPLLSFPNLLAYWVLANLALTKFNYLSKVNYLLDNFFWCPSGILKSKFLNISVSSLNTWFFIDLLN